MKNFYKDKMEFHFKQYQLSLEGNKEKSAAFHMHEYTNYEEMLKQQERRE